MEQCVWKFIFKPTIQQAVSKYLEENREENNNKTIGDYKAKL